MYNMLSLDSRKDLLEYIRSSKNIERKKKSVYQYEVFKNKLKDHVRNYLSNYIGPKSLKQMAIMDDVGMCERIIKQEASIYKEKPKRDFLNVNDEQKEKLRLIYNHMKYDEKGKIHNRFFKLQHQAISWIYPKNGKLIKKVLLEHQYDIIPNDEDPENPLGYVISNLVQPKEEDRQRYVIWTKDEHFKMDGRGIIIQEEGDDLKNPISPFLPIAVASGEKNGEYYLDEEETCVDFTVVLNSALTELYHVMRMQGFGQAVMIGSKKAVPTAAEIDVGINSIITLLVEEGQTADFKFVNANPDLAGSIEVISTLLSAFLSSKGLDPKTIAMKGDSPKTFSSGWERFLSLIEKFEATKDDLEVFQNVEDSEFKIITEWHNKLIGTDTIEKEYLSSIIPKTAKVLTEFIKPEMTMTEPERVQSVKAQEDAGYESRIGALKKVHNLESDEEAVKLYQKIQADNKQYPSNGAAIVENEEGVA